MTEIDPRAVALIKSFEKLRLDAYMPTPKDRATIGWGATFNPDGTPVRMGQHWTQAESDANFAASLAHFAKGVAALAVITTPLQLGALTSLAFNIGLDALHHSTVLRCHMAGDHAHAADAFLMWNRQAGEVLPGLTRRRIAETQLYTEGSR